MGKKSFNKRRGGGGGGGSGAGGPGLELMEVDPAPAEAAKISAKQKKLLPSTIRKVQLPSWESFIEAKRADDPEEAIQALRIPDLRGIVSTNDDPRVCAHCSATLPDGIPHEEGQIHIACGAIVCNGCFDEHAAHCSIHGSGMLVLNVKTGAPWAVFSLGRYAYSDSLGKTESHIALPSLMLAADAGHPHASFDMATAYEDGDNSYCLANGRDLPRDICSAAKYAKRAIVLDPRNYIGECKPILHVCLSSFLRDGRFKEAKVLAAQMEALGYDVAELGLRAIESLTCEPFYDQSIFADLSTAPPTVLSVDYLTHHNMSPEEIRLADYESGDGILRMVCTTLKVLSDQHSGSSCPLLAGLGDFIGSMHYLMQPANLDLYRSIPSVVSDVGSELVKVDPSTPTFLLLSEPFLLLMLTSVAALARIGDADIQVGDLDRKFLSITDAIIKNAKLPNSLRALALVIQADMFCVLPYCTHSLFSSHLPKEVNIRRRARALCTAVGTLQTCPLQSLMSRILDESRKRLAMMEGQSRHSALKLIAEILSKGEAGSLDSCQRVGIIEENFRITVGGSGCDQCGKSPLEANMSNLLKCRRCCQAHFCSNECASLAWDSWHGKSCRKVGDFSVGDNVCVKGFSFDKGNSGIRCGAKAVITDRVENGDWTVKALGASDDGTYERDVISSKNLCHLRSIY